MSGSVTAPRTAASSSSRAAPRSSPGRSLRMRLIRQRSGTAMRPPPSMPVTTRKDRPTSGCSPRASISAEWAQSAERMAWVALSASAPSSGVPK